MEGATVCENSWLQKSHPDLFISTFDSWSNWRKAQNCNMIYLKMVFDNIDQPCASILVAWTWVLIFYFAKMRFWWPCCTHQRHLSKDCSLYFPWTAPQRDAWKNFTFQVYDLQFLLSICYWLGQEHELHFDHNLKPINDHLVEYGKYFKQTWGILIEYNSEKFTKQATKILCFFLQVKWNPWRAFSSGRTFC